MKKLFTIYRTQVMTMVWTTTIEATDTDEAEKLIKEDKNAHWISSTPLEIKDHSHAVRS